MKYLISILFLLFSSICVSANNEPSISIGYDDMSGYTKYSIGGYVYYQGYTYKYHDPLSELEFSLDTNYLTIKFDHGLGEDINTYFAIAKNIKSETGKMKDSDWGIDGDSSSTLSIYSESDSELDALIYEFGVTYKLNSLLYFGTSYQYQIFQYDISNVEQYSPSGLSGYEAEVSGKVLEYDIEYNLLFLEGGLEYSEGRLRLIAAYQYAISATSKDRDNHILRSKISKTEAKGSATKIKLGAGYKFTDSFSMNLNYAVTMIELTGTQVQTFSDGDQAEIDAKVKSEQRLTTVDFEYLF